MTLTEKKFAIKPLNSRVLAKKDEKEEKLRGGIIIPDSAKEKPQTATVLAVGPGGIDKNGNPTKMPVKAGDRILYGKYAGQEISLDGEEYLIVNADDIIAIIE